MLLNLLQAVFALAVTLGLIGGAAYALRRWGPGLGLMQMRPQTDRRLQVVESLTLDAQRRLVLVRLDREERLVLLGEGRLLDPAAPSAKPLSN